MHRQALPGHLCCVWGWPLHHFRWAALQLQWELRLHAAAGMPEGQPHPWPSTAPGTHHPTLSPNSLLLLQDHCDGNGSFQDAFRVVTENIPCGTTGTTCSKDIKIFLGVSGMEAAEHPGAPQWGRGTPEGVWSWLAPEDPLSHRTMS